MPVASVQLDLGVADVHAPGTMAVTNDRPSPRSAGQHAAFVIVRNEDNEVLCVSRPEPPFEMSIPGGMVEAGESPEAAAIREVKEETGVRVTSIRHLRDLTSPTDGRPIHIYEASTWEGDAYDAEPGSKVEWLLPSVLASQAVHYRLTIQELLKHGDLHPPAHGNTRTMADNAQLEVDLRANRAKRRAARAAAAAPPVPGAKPVAAAAPRDNRKRVPKSIHVRADLARGGSLHVRHMNDRGFYCAESVNLTDDAAPEDAGPVWVQVAKCGSFLGHSAGPFKLDLQVFTEIIRNFKASQNQLVAADYEHASEAGATSGSIPVEGAPAQGWFKDFEIRDTNLWGLVEWLEPARSQIKAKKYKFLSPAIRFGTKDRVTGKPTGARLSSVALTNNPFLDGMEAIAAKDALASGHLRHEAALELRSASGSFLDAPVISPHEYMPKLRVALGLHELSTPQECSDRFASLRDMCMSVGPNGQHSGVSMGSYMSALRDVVGAGHGSTWSDLLETVQDMIDDAMDHHVETMHPAQMTHDGGGESAITTNPEETTTMAAEDAHTIALKDAQTKAEGLSTHLKDATTKLATKEGEVAQLTLQLKDVTAKHESAAVVLAKVEPLRAVLAVAGAKVLSDAGVLEAAAVELKDLREAQAKRAEADVVADVEAAFLTWRDKKGLAEGDKAHMLTFARTSREAFNSMYPPVAIDQRHLLRTTTPIEPREKAKRPQSHSATELTARFMTDKHMTYSEASESASKVISGEIPDPFAPAAK